MGRKGLSYAGRCRASQRETAPREAFLVTWLDPPKPRQEVIDEATRRTEASGDIVSHSQDANEGVRHINLGDQQWSARRIIYLTYPLVSFLATLILLPVATTYLEGGITSVTARDVFLKLAAIVFSILSVIGTLDGLFFDSHIGFSFARWLHLLDRSRLQDLAYKEDAKGKIEKGAETIQIALTLIYLVLTFLT